MARPKTTSHWRLWNLAKRQWVGFPYTGSAGPFVGDTAKIARAFKTSITRGRRGPLVNWFRISTVVVPVLTDDTSPRRDAVQKAFDQRHAKKNFSSQK